MPRKLPLEKEQFNRTDFFHIDPNAVFMEEGKRGRWKAPTEEQILEIAESIYDHQQQQPIQCRQAGDRLYVVMGFTRCVAARMIVDGFTGTDGVWRHDPERKLKCVIVDANEQQALLNNISENIHRNNTTPIDDAHNHRRMRDAYGMSDVAIAAFYKYKDPGKVGRLRKLLACPEPILDMIHGGSLSVGAALDVLELDLEAQDAQWNAILGIHKTNGRVVGSKVREQVRKHLNDDERIEAEAAAVEDDAKPHESNGQPHDDEPAEKPAKPEPTNRVTKSLPLSVKEIRDFWDGQAESSKSEHVRDFAGTMSDWMRGKVGEKAMLNAVKKLAGRKAE